MPDIEGMVEASEEKLFPRFVNAMYGGDCKECERGVIWSVISEEIRDDGATVTTSVKEPCGNCSGTGKVLDSCALKAATEGVASMGADQDLEVYARAAVYGYLERLKF